MPVSVRTCARACARVYMYIYTCMYWNDVMIHHMTQRCALIRVYREVEPLRQERCFALKAWFVLVCMHSSSKACSLLTTSASRPRRVRMVSSPCARLVRRWTSEHHQWSLLDGIGECSPPGSFFCCYNTSMDVQPSSL